MSKKMVLLSLVNICILLFSINSLQAQESKFKALFISKFTGYIQWPSSTETHTLGVLGNSPVLSELQKLVKTRSNIGLKLVKITDEEDVDKCDIIFLPSTQDNKFNFIKTVTKGKSILLIAETKGLASKGAGISFYKEDGKLKFIINKSVMDSKGLKVSQQLLGIAKVI